MPRVFNRTSLTMRTYGNPSKTVSDSTNTSDVVLNKQKLTRSRETYTPEESEIKHWSKNTNGESVISKMKMYFAGKYTK